MSYAHCLIKSGCTPVQADRIMDSLLAAVQSANDAPEGVYVVCIARTKFEAIAVARAACNAAVLESAEWGEGGIGARP